MLLLASRTLNLDRDFNPKIQEGEEFWNWSTLAYRVALYKECEIGRIIVEQIADVVEAAALEAAGEIADKDVAGKSSI